MKRLRAQRGMSQRDLARKARVSPGLIGQLEAGLRQSADVQIGLRIARALGLTVEALAGQDHHNTAREDEERDERPSHTQEGALRPGSSDVSGPPTT